MNQAGCGARMCRIGVVFAAVLGPCVGCTVVPRARIEESRQLNQSLRAENARLKDRVLALEVQNRDLADRAVDDLRRLTARDEAVEQLERSVQAYQDDRDRLAGAYRRLAMSLGRPAEGDRDARPAGTGDAAPSRSDRRGDLRAESLPGQSDGRDDGPRARPSTGASGP